MTRAHRDRARNPLQPLCISRPVRTNRSRSARSKALRAESGQLTRSSGARPRSPAVIRRSGQDEWRALWGEIQKEPPGFALPPHERWTPVASTGSLTIAPAHGQAAESADQAPASGGVASRRGQTACARRRDATPRRLVVWPRHALPCPPCHARGTRRGRTIRGSVALRASVVATRLGWHRPGQVCGDAGRTPEHPGVARACRRYSLRAPVATVGPRPRPG